MIETIPVEIFTRIAQLLSQEDKVSLTYVSKNTQRRISSSLYGNLFLNQKPYHPSDLDNSLGTNFWSVLYFTSRYDNDTNIKIGKQKFGSLVRSLQESPFRLCPLVKRVHCSWHLDLSILVDLIKLLMRYGINLRYFSNILDMRVSALLVPRASQFCSLDVTPPVTIPAGPADSAYYGKLEVMLSHYNWENLRDMTLHVNACTFFPHIGKPLRITSLCLNLRPDTHSGTYLEQPYHRIFDVEALQELEILSWYKTTESSVDLYETWNLHHFWKFRNIRNLTLLSLVANELFLRQCFQSFPTLTRLKVDYLFDLQLSPQIFDFLAQSNASKTIEYIDIKFENLQTPLISLDPHEDSSFVLNLSCKCQGCKETFGDIIIKKLFPTKDSLSIKNFNDIESRSYYLHVFNLGSILPYTHFIDRTPAIGYQCTSLVDHASEINYLLRNKGLNNTRVVNSSDVIRLYHARIHSLKKTYDFFISRFLNLKILTLNDLPTKVLQVDELQRCNIPIFYSEGYISNQIYELLTEEALFE